MACGGAVTDPGRAIALRERDGGKALALRPNGGRHDIDNVEVHAVDAVDYATRLGAQLVWFHGQGGLRCCCAGHQKRAVAVKRTKIWEVILQGRVSTGS